MTETFARILRRYGQRAAVNGGETRAFLQPVRERAKAAPFAVTPLGAVDDRIWLYLGGMELKPGDRVETEDGAFTARSCQPVRLGDETVYWWAALEAQRETAE